MARALPSALLFAQTLTRRSGAWLLLMRAALLAPSADEDTSRGAAKAMREAKAYLTDIVGAREAPTRVETTVLYGEAAEAILAAIRATGADLVVMSSRGHSGLDRWVCGTVTERVLRRTDVPVLLVPAACACTWPGGRVLRVLVPLDGSPLAEDATGAAGELARLLGAELFLLRVVDPLQRGGRSRGARRRGRAIGGARRGAALSGTGCRPPPWYGPG
jgi:nucleotide-binding universal stress UspA family protein